MAPEAPQYIPAIAGPISGGMTTAHGGDVGITMEDKFKGANVPQNDGTADKSTYIDVSCGDKMTLSYTICDCDANTVPSKPTAPPDRGYYARIFGGRKRR